jgi:WD40 repeat protein
VATGTQVGPDLPGGTDTDTAVLFSPDGSTLTSVNADGTARQWGLAALQGRPAAPPIHTGAGVAGDGMGDVALGPSSSLVTTDEDGNISVRVSTGGTQQAFPAMISYNPPVSSGDATYPPHLALSPDGRRLVTGGDNGTIQLWNLSSPQLATRPIMAIPVPETVDGGDNSMAEGIAWLAFSPDGSQFAAAYNDGSLQIFNTATGQPTGDSISGAAYAGSMLALAFAPGGDLITVDSTGSVTTWNPHASDFAYDLVTSTSVSFASQPDAVAVSPDRQTLAAGYADGTVQLWDIATNQQIGNPITTGDADVASLAFSADGTRLASGGDDGTVRLWDVSYLSPARDVARLGG